MNAGHGGWPQTAPRKEKDAKGVCGSHKTFLSMSASATMSGAGQSPELAVQDVASAGFHGHQPNLNAVSLGGALRLGQADQVVAQALAAPRAGAASLVLTCPDVFLVASLQPRTRVPLLTTSLVMHSALMAAVTQYC